MNNYVSRNLPPKRRIQGRVGFQHAVRLLLLAVAPPVAAWAAPGFQPPEVVEQTKPEYSAALRNAGISGQVTVQFTVDPTGTIQNVAVIKSDRPELAAPAVEAVKKWKFKPATRNDQPVSVSLQVPLTFSLAPTGFLPPMNFPDALRQADLEHKIVFLDFFTTWCPPCKLLDQTTWNDSAVIALLKEKTLAFRVDAEKNVDLAKYYGVQAYPTLALIRPNGTLIERLVGYRDAATFKGEFADALIGRTRLSRAREAVAAAGSDPGKMAPARYDLGKELALNGDEAGALAEYLWCFDIGMKGPSSYAGVRISYLLSDLTALGGHYPSALEALKDRRDGDQKNLSADLAADADFGALNHAL